jgi:CRISPR-associated protein (TIGR03984 family)
MSAVEEVLTEPGVAAATLQKAAACFVKANPTAIGWVLTPFKAVWVAARADGRLRWRGPAGEEDVPDALLTEAFEARLFTPQVEWRWVFDQRVGKGKICRIPDGDGNLEDAPFVAPKRLLWGQVAEVEQGWVRLADARVGSFWVPFAGAEKGDRLALKVVEYVAIDPLHHNVSVVDERFTMIATVPKDPGRTGGDDA